MIKFCKKCYEDQNEKCQSGYSYWWKDDISACPNDKTNLVNINFPAKDLSVLMDISETKPFIDAMINLYQTDIIEYELKMSQFRQQLEQQKQIQDNRPKCPTCQSTNIAKIDGLERAGSIAVFGLFSKKINKTFKCKNCGHTW
ncbi:hypothetical protein [Anaerotignum sp.]